MTTRRRFLQAGIAGAAALLALVALERARFVRPPRAGVLADEDARSVAALAAVILEGALPPGASARDAALARVVAGFERAAAALDGQAREDLARLLGLLRFAPSRIVLTRSWRPIARADEGEVHAFLGRWRESRFDLLRAAYGALTQLVLAAWYADPESWERTGYPGPPSLDSGPAR